VTTLVRVICDNHSDADLTFIGIGAALPSRDIFKEFDKLGYSFEYMQQHQVAGGINYNYFDIHGQQLGTGIFTLSIEIFRHMSKDPAKTVVLVGGGEHKKSAIKIAVKTGMVNALITDEDTA
jgi:DNA-binding transcriptional regulator LsrR (DeoR family)